MHRVRTQWRIPISIHALLTESDVAALRLCGSARCISIHALLAESDQIAREIATKARDFNPRSPCGERPLSPVPLRGSRNFNPRSPCGERPLSGGTTASRGNFNPRSPCGERLAQADSCIHSSAFQSTLSLRRATWSSIFRTSVCPFQSTLSLRRATCSELMILRPSNDFNPRSPCGERQGGREGIAMDLEFQSTLSLRRATLSSISLASPDLTFQSTLSLRRATPSRTAQKGA